MIKEKIILFVDDEEYILNSLRRNLKKWMKTRGLKIETASSSYGALSFLKDNAHSVAVIVSDQKMPDLEGSKLSGIVAEKYPDIAIIILSGHSDMSDVSEIVKAGVLSFLEKPWDIKVLQNEIVKALDIYNLRTENRKNRIRQEEELRLGREFQESILDITIPESKFITFNTSCIPSSNTGIGGDYFDIIERDPKHFIVLAGDVSGHGIQTAFLTAVIKSISYPVYIKNLNVQPFIPSLFLAWLNKEICSFLKKLPEVFITFSAALIDLDNNTITLANAGQPPVFKIADTGVSTLEVPGLVLGVDKDFIFKENQFSIKQGDKLFFCSDGIYPSGNPSETFNIEGLTEVLKKNLRDIHNHKKIIEELSKLTGEEWDDDITIITVDLKDRFLL